MEINELKALLYRGEKVDLECKEAEHQVPKSIYETYSAFANTNGGTILLGVHENTKECDPQKRFSIVGVSDAPKIMADFWNTINGNKVNANILIDSDVYVVEDAGKQVIVIQVPRTDYKLRPVYIGENPFKGSFKRNNEGDYHCSEMEVRAMIRDQNPEGNDGLVLEHFTMDDVDMDTLRRYRMLFKTIHPEHVWNLSSDLVFLENLGGYRKDRRKKTEGLTLAGLLMFGKGLAVRDEFDNIFMDYRDESHVTADVRWNDRITYDGTWENNLFNFFSKVAPKLTADLKKPFILEGMQRQDDTPVHRAVREALVNLIIHADYLSEGTLKVIKQDNGFSFTNPGILKLPKEDIYKGGNSKPRNSRMQTMLRMVGFGDNAGSGFPAILAAWKAEGWSEPILSENTVLNQVTLTMTMTSNSKKSSISNSISNSNPKVILKPQINSAPSKQDNEHLRKRIIALIQENSRITRRDLAEKTGVSLYAVTKQMAAMKKEHLVEFVGPSKTGHWVIYETMEASGQKDSQIQK